MLDGILNTDLNDYITRFAFEILWLEKEDIISLFERTLKLKNNENNILKFITILEERQILSYDEIKGIILNTKDHYLTATFIVCSKDYDLVNDIYGTIENLTLCIGLLPVEKNKKDTLIEKLQELMEEKKIEKYDDMLEDYLKINGANEKVKK